MNNSLFNSNPALAATFSIAARDPATEMGRATVLQVNATAADARSYSVEPGTVAGIITSPPYLCMSDYTLGQRLSYEWLAPQSLQVDFANEVGARRHRFHQEDAPFHPA